MGTESGVSKLIFGVYAVALIVGAAIPSAHNPAFLVILLFLPLGAGFVGGTPRFSSPEAAGFWAALGFGALAAVLLARKGLNPLWLHGVMFLSAGAYAGALVRSKLAARVFLGLFGGLWLLFALLGHGFSVEGLAESAFGLGLLAALGLSFPFPQVSGLLAVAAALGFAWMLLGRAELTPGSQAVLLGLILPTLAAGVMLLGSRAPKGRKL